MEICQPPASATVEAGGNRKVTKMENDNKPFVLDGHTLDFRFDMEIWAEIEEKFGLVDRVADRLESPGRIKLLPDIAAVMARDEAGEAWTPERIRAAMRPRHVVPMVAAINAAIIRGFAMETAEENEGAVVDETLEELEKNVEKGA